MTAFGDRKRISVETYDYLQQHLERKGMKTMDAIQWLNERYICEDTI